MMTRTLVLPLALAIGLASCGDPDPEQTPTEEPDMGAVEPDLPVEIDHSNDVCDGSGERIVYVVQTLALARELGGGVANGFDLDDYVTKSGDNRQGCAKKDFIDEQGVEGIDNQVARLLPAIEAVGGGVALSTLLQNAVNEGDVLFMVELSDVDDLENDGCVDIEITYGIGQPYISNEDLIEPWQTYDIDINRPRAVASGVSIVDGELEAGPFTLNIPFAVFQTIFPIDLIDGRFSMTITDEGHASGSMGGAVTIENLLTIANMVAGGQDDFPPIIDTIGRGMADLLPDENNKCQALSAAMELELVGAFIYSDSPRFEDP